MSENYNDEFFAGYEQAAMDIAMRRYDRDGVMMERRNSEQWVEGFRTRMTEELA